MSGSIWNLADSAAVFGVSADGKTARTVHAIIGVAVNRTTKKVHIGCDTDAGGIKWNNNNNPAVQSPALGNGGVDITTLDGTGDLYPMVGSFHLGANLSETANFGASTLKNPVPAGYTTMNAAAGAAVTWGTVSGNLTKSNGDLTVTHTASHEVWSSARATHVIPAGAKVYFEMTLEGQQHHMTGIGNASVPVSQYPGQTANGGSHYGDGNNWYYGGSPTGVVGTLPVGGWRVIRASTARTTGFKTFETTITPNSGAQLELALANASCDLFSAPTLLANAVSMYIDAGAGGNNTTIRHNNVVVGSIGSVGVNTARTFLWVVHFPTLKLWIYNPANGLYNNGAIGAQNPVGLIGGISIAGPTGALFPAFASLTRGSLTGPHVTVALNTTGSYVNATEAAAITGATPWDTPDSVDVDGEAGAIHGAGLIVGAGALLVPDEVDGGAGVIGGIGTMIGGGALLPAADIDGGAGVIGGTGTMIGAAELLVFGDVDGGAGAILGRGSVIGIWPGPLCEPWEEIELAESEWLTEQACYPGYCPA